MGITSTDLRNSVNRYLDKQGDENLLADLFRALSRCVYYEYNQSFIFVYGSLRKGEYNYERIRNEFGTKSFVSIGKTYISSAKLYDLGDYPAVITADYANKVYGDIVYCNERAFETIKEMEEGAGFKLDKVLSWLPVTSTIQNSCFLDVFKAGEYLTNIIKKQEITVPHVVSGDWSKYIRETEEEIL